MVGDYVGILGAVVFFFGSLSLSILQVSICMATPVLLEAPLTVIDKLRKRKAENRVLCAYKSVSLLRCKQRGQQRRTLD